MESPLVTSDDAVQREEETANDNTDILTGVAEGDPNIPLIATRKAAKKDPGNNAKNALNLGKVGDDPIKRNDNIGFNSGGTKDRNDYYKFTLTGKENDVSVVVDGLNDNANVQLLDTNGKDVLFKSAEKGKKTETIDAELDKGTYFLRVFPQGSAKTQYGVSISAEEILQDPDSKPSGATNLGPLGKKKKTFNDEIGFRRAGTRDNSDFYEFTLVEEFNDFNIVLDGLKDNANITLFDEDGKTIIDQSRRKGKSKEIIDGVLEAGNYYLKVQPQGSAKTKYQLSFDSDKINDPDGNLNRAQEIKIGKKPKKIRDEVGFEVGGRRDQRDYYEFTLNKDSEVNLTLDGLNQNVDLQLLGDKGDLLYSSSNKGKDVEQINTILDKGQYYALVKPVGSDRSEYTLSLDVDSNIKDPDAQLPGNNLGKLKAKPITERDKIGFKEKGFVDTSDFWRFELTKETDLAITLDRLSQNADLELYDEDGTTLIFSSQEKGKKPEEISAILDKGTYYIKVKPQNGSRTNYELSLEGNPKIGERDDALPGKSLGELSGETVTKKDQIGFKPSGNVRDLEDFYNFSLGEESRVNITLDGLSANATLSLLATDGGEIEVSDNKGSKDEAIDRSLSAGNYYIGVAAEGNAKTNYDLGVTANVRKDDFNSRKNAKQLGTLNLQDQVREKDSIGFAQGGVRDTIDYYSFNLTESSDVILTLDGLDRDANLLLLDKNDQLANSTIKGVKAESIKKKLKAGTYYAAIVPVGGARTDYQLSLDAVQKTVDLSSLRFNALDVQDGLNAGEKVKVNYQVNNIGNTKADDFKVGFYLSKDEGIDSGDFLLDTVDIKSISGGQNTKKTKQLTLPNGGDDFWQGSGDYYLGMIVDSENDVTEDNELNNTSSKSVGIEISSDLKLSGFDVQQETVNPGQKFNANVTVQNIGGKIDDDFQVGFYVSSDNEITTSDTFIGSEKIASLGGNKTTTISKQLTLPENSINGKEKYFVGAIADYQNALTEVNETNNISQERVSLSPVPEDNAGNELNKARNVGVVGNQTKKFSDWIGDFYGVSEDTHDYYKIELDGRSNLNLTLNGLSANANLYLYDDDGDFLEQSINTENKKEEISRKLLPGTYYALVWQDNGGNTDYNLEMSAPLLKYPVEQVTGWNRDTALDLGEVGTTAIKKTEYVGNLHGFADDLNDFYQFQVEDDSTVQIDLTGLNGNADLYLYNSESSSSIAKSETVQKVDEGIVKNLTPGTYFIEVQSINDAETTYDLQIVGTPLPNNSAGWNPDLALDLEDPLGGATVNDWVGDIDAIDYYRFDISEKSTVDLSLTGMSNNANIQLFNDKQDRLASSSQTGNADDRIAINLNPGSYFLEVERYSGVVGTPYNLQVSATSRAEDLVGNNLDTAKDIGALTTFNQTEWVGSFDVSDYYKFSLAEDSTVNLNLTGMNGNGQLYLYDNEGEQITYSVNEGNADEVLNLNLNPGTYYAGVLNSGNYSTATNVNYTFSASAKGIPDSGGDTLETAGDMGDITAAKAFRNWVGNVDPSDYYKFTLTEDSDINFSLTGMDGNGELYLYDTEGEVITSSTNDSNTDDAIITNLNPGTYYLGVWRYKARYGSDEATSVNYNLTASATAIPDSGGNTLETAGDMGDITAAKTFSNWVGSADPDDYYKFTIAGDSTVNLNLTGMNDNGELYLYDSEGEQITSSTNDSNTDEAIALNLNSGTYYARVLRYKPRYGNEATSVNYNLTASATLIPDSTGSEFDTARDLGIVSTPQTISDWVGDLQYNDYYKFSVAQNSSMNLNLGGLTANTGLYLYDRNEKLIASSDNDDNADESIVYNLASGNTYYLLVDGRSPSYGGGNTHYNLDLSPTPLTYSPANLVGNTEAQTKNIGALSTAQTFTDFVGNQYLGRDKNDYYQFTLTETSTVNLNLSGMTADADLVLLNSEYSQITESSQLTNIDEGIVRNLVAGTYIAQVKSIENANTGYNLQLSATPHPDAAGETFATARQIGTLAAPLTFNDWIGNVDESDYYQFAIDAASTVNINLGGMTGNGNIKLYDINAETLSSSTNTENVDDVIVADLSPSTYLVEVENARGNFGTNYSLQISPTVRVDNAGGADAPLDLGALTTASATNWVSPGIDNEDYYKFSIAQNSTVNLNLTNLTDDVDFKLYDSNLEEIASASNDSNTETAIAKNLTPGTYFVEVSNFWDNGTEYNFTASATALPDNAGNSTDTARQVGALAGVQTFSDWVGNIDSDDYYQYYPQF